MDRNFKRKMIRKMILKNKNFKKFNDQMIIKLSGFFGEKNFAKRELFITEIKEELAVFARESLIMFGFGLLGKIREKTMEYLLEKIVSEGMKMILQTANGGMEGLQIPDDYQDITEDVIQEGDNNV